MWIPYDLHGRTKPEGSPEAVQLSKSDTTARDFVVAFYLRNPATQTWEVDVKSQTATDVLRIEIEAAPVEVAFYGGESGKVNEVIYRLKASSSSEALETCHADIEDRLSIWCLELGRGMSVAGWRIADPKHQARWRCIPCRASALALDPARVGLPPQSHGRLLALYREARNASDPSSRLLFATAILSAWRRRDEPFASTDRRLAGVGRARGGRTVGFEMLLHCGALAGFGHLLDRPLDQLVVHLEALRLAALGRLEDRSVGFAGASFGERSTFSQMANLADYAAREVLLEELALCGSEESVRAASRSATAGASAAQRIEDPVR